MSYDTATPYIASYVIVREGKNIAFVLRANTSWMNDHYGLPSGKVENDESYEQAAVREAKEEIGIDVKQSDLKHILTVHRKDRGDNPYWVDVYFEADTWEGEVVNAEPHMHSEVAWLDPENLPENTIPAVRFAIDQINQGKSYCEYGWQEAAKV